MRTMLAFLSLTAAVALVGCHSRAKGSVDVELTAEAVTRDVRHFGVNLGSWTTWGAEQLPSNVIKNPGFEGVIDRALVTVAYSRSGEFSDETSLGDRTDSGPAPPMKSLRFGRWEEGAHPRFAQAQSGRSAGFVHRRPWTRIEPRRCGSADEDR